MNQAVAFTKITEGMYEKLVNRFLDDAHGVIHVGANTGQEREIYAERGLPVIWIEPLNGIFEHLCHQIAPYSEQRALQYLITDKDGEEYRFGVASNGAQSSSIYEFGRHGEIWPGVAYLGFTTERSTTLKTVIEQERINQKIYDALIMDVQGAELLVLKGAGDLLNKFRWVRAECADFEMYKDSCQMADIDAYLLPRGWQKVEVFGCVSKEGVGNCYEVVYRNLISQ